jgi:hypothetical protein
VPEPAELPLPDGASVTLEGLTSEGAGAITGTIDGEAFEARDVRFRVIRYGGRQRIDLLVSDRAIERCGLPQERPETLVWLRFAGDEQLAPGRYVSGLEGVEDVLERDVSVHWERPVGEGIDHSIHTSDRGVAQVSIESATATHVRGVMSVCFADARGDQCVRGRFDAAPCLSRIDGRTAREPPGLVNAALEPSATRPAPLRPTRTYERASDVDAGAPAAPTDPPPTPTADPPATPPSSGAAP